MIDISALPNCLAEEKVVLGCCFLYPDHLGAAISAIEPGDFELEAHRRIFRRMADLYECSKPVDRVTLLRSLSDHGELASIGGFGYLNSLDDGLPRIANFDSYLRTVQETSLRRKLIFAADKLALSAMNTTDSIEEIIESHTNALNALQSKPTDELMSTAGMIQAEGIDALLGPRSQGAIRLPWSRLQDALAGLNGGQLVVLMAGTSKGKTSLALQIAAAAAMQGRTPLIWTMEMSCRSLFRRLSSQISGMPLGGKMLTFDERHTLLDAVAVLNDNPLWFDRGSRTVSAFRSKIRKVGSTSHVSLGVVDYLQLIRGSGKNRAQEVSDNSRSLKTLAMDLNIPMLVLSQVDRASIKGDGKIGLHSAKESGDIENDADVVLWIEGAELSRDRDTPVRLHVGKQREGPAGFAIPMVYKPSSQTFMEVAE